MRAMQRSLWAGLTCFLFSSLVYAQVPQPQGRVNDFAGVISTEYQEKINALIQEVEQKTSAEIAVVTQPSIAPYGADQYAQALFDNWKIGKKGRDNGVLILLAVKEREWRIQTGYGVEGILPDSVCGRIGRDYMVPYFKEGKYAEGLYYGVAAAAGIIGKDANISLSGLSDIKLKPQEDVPGFLYFFAFFFFLIWNLPWPVFIGLPFTLFFALVFFLTSPLLGGLVIAGYICSMIIRYNYWKKLPPGKRGHFWNPVNYGSTFGGGYQSGGFGSGGFGGGGGGFGGGSSGGGGAGGRF